MSKKRGEKKNTDKDAAMAETQAPAAAAAAPTYVNGMLDGFWVDNVGDGVPPQVLAGAAPFPAPVTALGSSFRWG